MQVLLHSYDRLLLQQLRAELESRRIGCHLGDEYLHGLPGMPGAEQPRALWITAADDLPAAQRVVIDLLGEEHPDVLAMHAQQAPAGATPTPSEAKPGFWHGHTGRTLLIVAVLALLAINLI